MRPGRRALVVGLVGGLAGAAVPRLAQVARAQLPLAPLSADLRVEWDLGKDRRGNLVLSGYVYNNRTGYHASGVRLRVTGTDRSGRVVVDTVVPVYGDVPPQGRAYFEVRIASLEPSYHVNVVGVEFRAYGAGG